MHTNSMLSRKAGSLPLMIAMAVFVALAFTVQASAQKIITIDAPGAGTASGQGTWAYCSNIGEMVLGYYTDPSGVYHGFLRTQEGRLTIFEAPWAGSAPGQGTQVYGVVPDGWSTGNYADAEGNYHGFMRDPDGHFIRIDVLNAGLAAGQGTFPGNINPSHQVSGSFVDSNGMNHGFLREPDGRLITFDVPDAASGPGLGTAVAWVTGMNPEGAIAGWYFDAGGSEHGYLRKPDGWITTYEGCRAALKSRILG